MLPNAIALAPGERAEVELKALTTDFRLGVTGCAKSAGPVSARRQKPIAEARDEVIGCSS